MQFRVIVVTDPQNTNTHRHKQANKQNKQTNKQRNPQTGPLSLARSVINSISAMGYIISSCKNGCRLNSIKNHIWCVLLDTSQHSFKAFCIVCIAVAWDDHVTVRAPRPHFGPVVSTASCLWSDIKPEAIYGVSGIYEDKTRSRRQQGPISKMSNVHCQYS